MDSKTPVSLLQELCVQEDNSTPIYEELPTETPKTFRFVVMAFDYCAQGQGQSKKIAKHEASSNLIAILKTTERFKHKLGAVPALPRQSSEGDAVGNLLDICIQRNWPIARFEVLQAYGEPHKPIFTVICQVASIKRTGVASTKKTAKQIAAREMLAILQNVPQNESEQQVATLDTEPPSKIMRTYREWKNSDIKHVTIRLSQRHNHFMRLPQEDRNAIYDILHNEDESVQYTDLELVNFVCKKLNVKYEVKPVEKHPLQHCVFTLQGDYDTVVIGKESELYGRVVDYFKTMMNFQFI